MAKARRRVIESLRQSLAEAGDIARLEKKRVEEMAAMLAEKEREIMRLRECDTKDAQENAGLQAQVKKMREALVEIQSIEPCKPGCDVHQECPIIERALSSTPSSALAELEARVLRKAGEWFKAWADMPASYARAGEALDRMADEVLRQSGQKGKDTP